MFYFYTPWKRQKTFGFLWFSDIFRGYRDGIGLKWVKKQPQALRKITQFPPNFLVWKFYGKAELPYSFGRIETMR